MSFRRRAWMTIAAMVAAAGVGAPAAQADHHEMLVQEIFPGSTANPGQDYVALQMYSSGQRFVGGHTITVYGPAGTVVDTVTFPSDVTNGANQSTVLAGAAASVVGVTPDHVDSGMTAMDPVGGAVCWNASPISFTDCVSWGNFSGSLPSLAGIPADSPGGIPDGQVLTHSYTQHGCETTLDAADDTNESQEDFSGGLPVPRNNASTPLEEACPNTSITKGPDGKTKDRTPTFKFKSVPEGAPSFRCAVDDDSPSAFDTCSSPFTLPRQSLGKHKFFVAAVNSQNGPDPTPVKRAFKVIKKN